MQKSNMNIITRRAFLSRSAKIGMAAGLASLVDIPFVMKRALAEGSIGINGKKILFIWLRGANDALNSVIPAADPQYATARPSLGVTADPSYTNTTGGAQIFDAGANATYGTEALGLGTGFAALHPTLKFLSHVYNAGELAMVHRVGYPRQSRSHFDSQRYWENGNPNNNIATDGIFYRAIYESGLANTAPLTGVSIQSSLPLILRGSQAAMTNLSDPTRYNLLSIPDPANAPKFDASFTAANSYPFPSKANRNLLSLQYNNLQQTLALFAQMDFTEAGNTFQDDVKTDGDVTWGGGGTGGDPSKGYFLFPTTNVKNGGWRRPDGSNVFNKYAVDPGHQSFFNNLKAAAIVLNQTGAIIAGTQLDGFDTHVNQGQVTGAHPNLNRVIGWSIYALRKFFKIYGRGGTNPMPGATTSWDDVVIVTLSEFGRTTVENSDAGTDHAEAGVMWVAGGTVKGYGRSASGYGVFNCSTNEISGAASEWRNWYNNSGTSAMFGVSNGYLRRNTDYRSVLGEIIRKHLGATQNQLNRIIPAYAITNERLLGGGVSGTDGHWIRGEVGIL